MARIAKTIAIPADIVRLQLFRGIFAVAAFALAIALAGYSKAGASHDGMWRVTIITQSGDCDPAYSYAVKVSGGQISYSGDGGFDISGSVGEGGNVNVSIGRGDQRASASGKLNGNTGAGQWSGKSASTACSGRWEAVRSL
ncbi:hypothetical protein JQ557_02000 [Bradyrhizobium sp. U87765 SZCCT0131]|uniref:hypothetical protein n=1 Tax=unclassified Bradyrhizobium TaxID=2631580 RepID=UPI001BA7112D|nr:MULTISPECIES: hypothetical protein [unclassified Bradyrhizobium]MBR1216747.1 hypothetical protein [Bradyrhizobium sp. U87765 SZCCT0131]MBR1259497.1 hypothetical protein [Bradyrhizobium sp. U87765 SZCCT0134]MBR1305638.1 hypothetical protein [Bradyrhizobium sp. U87765 SZCCT0110]MBR1322005.1 hypothetical protein [Bradyrhizobium sp. U87765 SZCCT0109]MBR1350717.1 hypothetical protein [Bradyrhizobium sp. U87765 SZCCT0048]